MQSRAEQIERQARHRSERIRRYKEELLLLEVEYEELTGVSLAKVIAQDLPACQTP